SVEILCVCQGMFNELKYGFNTTPKWFQGLETLRPLDKIRGWEYNELKQVGGGRPGLLPAVEPRGSSARKTGGDASSDSQRGKRCLLQPPFFDCRVMRLGAGQSSRSPLYIARLMCRKRGHAGFNLLSLLVFGCSHKNGKGWMGNSLTLVLFAKVRETNLAESSKGSAWGVTTPVPS
ncbi:hypothetical protein L0Y40_00525, partial [Candidatus Wolfebacteria bacterium]|nr:hypothetical protein [Candidatus Wolfebacteria bacterium]